MSIITDIKRIAPQSVTRTIFSRSIYCDCMDDCPYSGGLAFRAAVSSVHDADGVLFSTGADIDNRRGDDVALRPVFRTESFGTIMLGIKTLRS